MNIWYICLVRWTGQAHDLDEVGGEVGTLDEVDDLDLDGVLKAELSTGDELVTPYGRGEW